MRPITAALFGFLALQVLPLPAGLVRILSPGELWLPEALRARVRPDEVHEPVDRPGGDLRRRSFPGRALHSRLPRPRTVSRGRQIRTLLAILIGSGVFQALYGLFELTRDDPRILFYKKMFSPDSVTGTFVNRSHFSGYLEMIVPLALGLAIARMNMMTFGTKTIREKLVLWTSKGILVNVLILGGAVVMSLAVVLSNSRSGLVVLAFSVFLLLGFSVTSFSRTGFRQPWIGKTIRTTFLCRHDPGPDRRHRVDHQALRPRRPPPRGPSPVLGQHPRDRQGFPSLRRGPGHLRLGL